VLLLAAGLWLSEALPPPVTALIVPLLSVALGVFSVKEAFAPFAHPLIFLFLGSFALAAALSARGLDAAVARLLTALSGGRFLRAAFLLMLSAFLLSMWMSNTSTTAVLVPLALGLTAGLNDRRAETFLLLGVAYGASVGGTATLVGSPPNGIAAELLGLSFTDWLVRVFPLSAVLFALLFLVLYALFRPPKDACVAFPEEEGFTWTRERLGVLLVFVLTASAWMAGKPLSRLLGIDKGFDAWVAVLALVALFSLRLLSWEEFKEGVSWGTLLLFGGGLALSEVMKKTGAGELVASLLSKAVNELGLLFALPAVVLTVVFLTETMSNTAATALLAPILLVTAQKMGLEPEKLVLPAAVAASCAFMLPVATPPNAVVYATGKVKQSSMVKAGLVLNLLFALVISFYFLLRG